jgi:hypothetical protein
MKWLTFKKPKKRRTRKEDLRAGRPSGRDHGDSSADNDNRHGRHGQGGRVSDRASRQQGDDEESRSTSIIQRTERHPEPQREADVDSLDREFASTSVTSSTDYATTLGRPLGYQYPPPQYLHYIPQGPYAHYQPQGPYSADTSSHAPSSRLESSYASSGQSTAPYAQSHGRHSASDPSHAPSSRLESSYAGSGQSTAPYYQQQASDTASASTYAPSSRRPGSGHSTAPYHQQQGPYSADTSSHAPSSRLESSYTGSGRSTAPYHSQQGSYTESASSYAASARPESSSVEDPPTNPIIWSRTHNGRSIRIDRTDRPAHGNMPPPPRQGKVQPSTGS